MEPTRRNFVALGCGAATAMAGCLSVGDGGDGTTAADLEAQLADLDRPETMIATVETTVERDRTTTTTTDEITARLTGETYVEGRSDDRTFRNVGDGDRSWFHDLERNRVAVMDSAATGESHIDYIYGEATTYFDQLEARFREETTLDGRGVYRVRFDPPPDETVERSVGVLVGNTEFVIPLETEEREDSEFQRSVERIDVWFDRETLFPVKQVVGTDEADFDAVYTSLSLNEPVDDDLFAYDPPAVADYPYANDLQEVSVRYAGDESVGESIRVGACNGPRPFALDGETVAVDGVSGTIVESDLGTTVEWRCGERTYYVFATTTVDRETALSVAESIDVDCDDSSH